MKKSKFSWPDYPDSLKEFDGGKALPNSAPFRFRLHYTFIRQPNAKSKYQIFSFSTVLFFGELTTPWQSGFHLYSLIQRTAYPFVSNPEDPGNNFVSPSRANLIRDFNGWSPVLAFSAKYL